MRGLIGRPGRTETGSQPLWPSCPAGACSASCSPAAGDTITFERATAVCPNERIAANLVRRFGLARVDYHAVREAHEEALGRMANAFGETLGEKGAAMHFQRVVGALVSSAFAAGGFYGDKVTEARDLTAELVEWGSRCGQ